MTYLSIVHTYLTHRCNQIWVSEWNHVLWSVPGLFTTSASNTKFSHTRGGGVRGGCENVRPENNFSKNREREITFTEIREREIRR